MHGRPEGDSTLEILGEIIESSILVSLALHFYSLPKYYCWLAFFFFKNTVFGFIGGQKILQMDCLERKYPSIMGGDSVLYLLPLANSWYSSCKGILITPVPKLPLPQHHVFNDGFCFLYLWYFDILGPYGPREGLLLPELANFRDKQLACSTSLICKLTNPESISHSSFIRLLEPRTISLCPKSPWG